MTARFGSPMHRAQQRREAEAAGFELAARERKARAIAVHLRRHGYTADRVAEFGVGPWSIACAAAGQHTGSTETKALTISIMRELER